MPSPAQPLDLLAAKTLVPSDMRSAEWSRVAQWTRERSFYMSGVTRHEILQEMRDIVKLEAAGEAGEYELRKRWEETLERIGYKPEPGQEGTIKDLRSLRRFNIALRTNRALMNGWARKERGMRPGPMKAQPCWELVRQESAVQPRDWPARFVEAGGTIYGGRMIAPKTSPVWEELGSIERFDDALGVDYPPFAWGSGMGWDIVGAREAMDLGVMTAEQIRDQAESAVPVVSSPNESLQSKPAIVDQDLRESLAKEMAGLVEWIKGQGSRATDEEAPALIFTDPNGTRPADEAGLARIWSRPLPAAFHDIAPEGLFQRQAVLDFADDPERFSKKTDRDAWDDLARAVGRLSASPSQRRRTMRAIADHSDLSWIDLLLGSPAWRAAMAIETRGPRAARIAATIAKLF